MSETNLNIDTVDAPLKVKTGLRQLLPTVKLIKQVRKGGNGYLFFGFHNIRGERVAIKFIDWSEKKALLEPKYLASIDAKHIIKIFDANLIDNDLAYFITPFYKNGDLDDYLSRGLQGNKKALELCCNVLDGLSILHSRGLLHRDLKPENIFLSDAGEAIIGDFGSVSRIPDGASDTSGSGHSLLYRPPESLSLGRYSARGDIYQVSVLLYQLLGGKLSYELDDWLTEKEKARSSKISDDTDKQIFGNECLARKIRGGRLVETSTLPCWVDMGIKKIIIKGCHTNPEKRYQNCTEFLVKLAGKLITLRNWEIIDGKLTLTGKKRSYRIIQTAGGEYIIEKRGEGNWRRENSIRALDLSELVREIELLTI